MSAGLVASASEVMKVRQHLWPDLSRKMPGTRTVRRPVSCDIHRSMMYRIDASDQCKLKVLMRWCPHAFASAALLGSLEILSTVNKEKHALS